MSFYIVKQKLRGRKSYCRNGQRRTDKDSKNYSRSYREPWLLVFSNNGKRPAKKVVALYKHRMSIEEVFRDLKSTQYGFSLKENITRKHERLIVWLMLAAFFYNLTYYIKKLFLR